MAQKMYLKLNGIKGESRAARHVGEIEILGWSWGGRQRGQMLALGAPPGELADHATGDLNVTKARDTTSQALTEACVSGRQFPEATVTSELVSDNGSLRRAVITKLKMVLITSFSTNGAGAESLALSFEKAEVVHVSNEE